MIHNNGKVTCDAEIGHWSRGWHVCNRNAVRSHLGRFLALDACTKHLPRMLRDTPAPCWITHAALMRAIADLEQLRHD